MGGVSVSKVGLSEAARLARNRYQREWHQAHPEKEREYRQRYWERKAKKDAEKRKKSEETGRGDDVVTEPAASTSGSSHDEEQDGGR